MKRVFTVLLLLQLIGFQLVSGQSCCSGGVPIAANLGMPVNTTSKWQATLTYDLNVLNTLLSKNEQLDDKTRSRITQSMLFGAGYNINDRFSVDALIPLVHQQRRITPKGLSEDYDQTTGLGDIVFLLRYRLSNPNNTKNFITIGAGPKLPTGVTNIKDEGIILNLDMQPGSGAWDAIFWTNLQHTLSFRPSAALFSTLTYRATGTNGNYLGALDYALGNSFQWLAGISDQFLINKLIVDASLSFRYRKAEFDQIFKSKQLNTGGESVFILPGIRVGISSQLSFQLTTELPLYSFVNGIQLTPTYRINTGFHYVFNKKLSQLIPIE